MLSPSPQGYIAVLLLLAFWFVVRRKMARHRTRCLCVGGWVWVHTCMCVCTGDLHCPPSSLHCPCSQGDALTREEKGELFPGISRAEAEQSLWAALKYSVNHAFDYVGAEVRRGRGAAHHTPCVDHLLVSVQGQQFLVELSNQAGIARSHS